MAQKQQITANEALELLKTQVVEELTTNQRMALYKAFKEDGSAMNPDIEATDFEPSENDKAILVTVKSPFFKKSCFKSVSIEIEKESYIATFTKEEWNEFQKAAIEITKS